MIFTNERITQFLKEIREEAKLTQIEMAEKLNMSQSHVSKYEKGRKIIDLETFVRWTQITNSEVQAAAILFGTDVFNTIIQTIPLIPAFIQTTWFLN